MEAKTHAEQLARLRQDIVDHFNDQELRDVCFDLGIDYETLPGEGKASKARELVAFCARKERIPELERRVGIGLPGLRPPAPPQAHIPQPAATPLKKDTDALLVTATEIKGRPPISPNPFNDIGRITDPSHFFDREELLRQIFEELSKGVNLSLVGESQMGKSSVLSMVCAMGPARLGLPAQVFVYLSLEWVDSEDDFYAALCEALQIDTSRGYQLTRALRGKRCVLCLDEMEKMAWKGFTARVRSQLRGLADGRDAPLKLVIASRSPLSHLFPDSPELDSPLAGICHQLDIKPFSPDVARAFLQHRLRDPRISFSENEIAMLLSETGGHPAKLQRAAADLHRRYTSRG